MFAELQPKMELQGHAAMEVSPPIMQSKHLKIHRSNIPAKLLAPTETSSAMLSLPLLKLLLFLKLFLFPAVI